METKSPEKPLILALETATPVSSVAVFQGDVWAGGMEFHTDKLHAKLLTVMIDQVLSGLGLVPADLDAIGISSGPGSYTGLRVGVSTAKGLCFALDKPLLTLNSLEVLAWSVKDFAASIGGWICPLVDARRMEVYSAVYDADLHEISPVKAAVVDADFLKSELEQRRILLVGDGAAKCQPILDHPNALFLPNRKSTAFSMGKPLSDKFIHGKFEDLVTFEPFYLKDFVATQSKKNRLLG
jgi:tRNA threonylcarbamoyladenosine biosynthesis protein TsaB